MSEVKPLSLEPAATGDNPAFDGDDRRLTIRFCETNLKEQEAAVRIRRALEAAPESFKAHVRVVTVRCADRCRECDTGPMVVVGQDAVAPATLRQVVEEVTRRVAPEKLGKKQKPPPREAKEAREAGRGGSVRDET